MQYIALGNQVRSGIVFAGGHAESICGGISSQTKNVHDVIFAAVPSCTACSLSDGLFDEQERKLKRAAFMMDRAFL